jgi:hypothetical protein
MSNAQCRSKYKIPVFTSLLDNQHSIFIILKGVAYAQLKLSVQYSYIIEPPIVLIGI